MRIVISGTHASGKSTLISDFAVRHPEFIVLPDPFNLLNETLDSPSAAMFAAQLRIAADRLRPDEPAASIIAERGPLDFLAYLLALDDLTGSSSSRELLERAAAITTEALRNVDVVVVLPLASEDQIVVGSEEHPALRDAMNHVLLDLIDDFDLVGDHAKIVEIVGDRTERLSALELLVLEPRG